MATYIILGSFTSEGGEALRTHPEWIKEFKSGDGSARGYDYRAVRCPGLIRHGNHHRCQR